MPLRALKAGEPITEDWIADLVDTVLAAVTVRGAGGLSVTRGPNGVMIRNDAPSQFFVAELTDTLQKNDKDKAASIFGYDHSLTDPWADRSESLPYVTDPDQGLRLAGERHLLHFSPAAGQFIPIPGVQIHLGKVSGSAISAGNSGTVEVYKISSGTLTDSTFSVTAYDYRTAGPDLAVNAQVIVWYHRQSKRWYIFNGGQGGGSMIWGTLAATISGDPTSCNVSKCVNGTSPGSTVNVYQPSSAFFTGNSGARYQAVYGSEDAKWYFCWVDECH